MSRAALQEKLDTLRLRATETYRLNESSRQHLYRTLSQAYLYWRECQAEPEWLEKQYKREGIDHKPREDNQINFRPLIRLVFGIKTVSGYDNNKCTQWATVLRKLDELYAANPAGYQSNAENKLAADIDALGGVTNIVTEDKGGADPAETLKVKPNEAKEMKRKKLTEDELAKRSIQLLAGSSTAGIGTATANSVVRADENEFVALLGRREKDGAITLLGYTNQPDAINTLAIYATKRNYHLLPASLRQIAEILAVQIYPYGARPKSKAAASVWQKRILYDQLGRYTLKPTKDGKAVKAPVATPRRLLIRGTQGDIIYSNMRMNCCVVTRCKPAVKLLAKKQNIYLKTEERQFVDVAINQNELELLTATPKGSLRAVTSQAYIYDLALTNPFTNQKRALHFYEQGRKEDSPHSWQGDFAFDAYKPAWRAKIDSDWLLKLRAEW